MAEKWVVGQDAGTGLAIYFNIETQESQWEEPFELKMPDGWEMGFVEGRQFFANRETGESVWERPLLSALQSQQLAPNDPRAWEVDVDQEGRTFYFNTVTNQSEWEPPPELVAIWDVDMDEEGRTFYFNTLTQSSQWDPPPELQQQQAAMAPPLSAGSSRPGSKRRRKRRPESRGSVGSNGGGQVADWEINRSDDGAVFYFNLRTSATQWDEPEELKMEDGWVQDFDDTGRAFYVNDGTGETTWERPVRKGGRKGRRGGDKAAVDISTMTEKEIEAMNWEEEKDGSGNPFWVNTKTGEMAMEKPECLVSDHDSEEEEDVPVDPVLAALESISEEDWDLIRHNSAVVAVWGNWETYVHMGKPDRFDKEQEKLYKLRVKEKEKERATMLEIREKRLEDVRVKREEEDKKAARLTLKRKRELIARREKEDQAEEILQQEEEDALVPAEQKQYPPFAVGDKFWYHIADDKCVWDDPVLPGWTDGSTDGSESTDAPTTDEEGKDGEDSKVDEQKEAEGGKEEEAGGKMEHGGEEKVEREATEKQEIKTEGKTGESTKTEGKTDESGEKVKRRIKRRVKRRDMYGEDIASYRPFPKPPIRRSDKKVNACFNHQQRFLDMSRQALSKLPRRILTQTKTVVRHVSLEDNEIDHISEKETENYLLPMKHLAVLDLRSNLLEEVPYALYGLKSLTAISFAHNKIESLPASIFLLTNLTALSLSQNKLKHFPAELGVQTMRKHKVWELNIGGLVSLTSLDLSQNLFEDLPVKHPSQQREAQFGDLTALTHLDMSINHMTVLPEECSRLTSLTHIDLSENKMETFPAPLLNLSNLEHLMLAHNSIRTLPAPVDNFKLISILNLKNNGLEELPETLGNLKTLNDLDLSCNKLTSLPDTLGGLVSLITINISVNAIESLPDSIGGMTATKYLHANKNKIAYVSPNIKNMVSLVKLDLSENEIDPAGFPGASFVHLAKLKELHLQHNRIDEIPEGWGPGLASLETLDISYNALGKIGKDFPNCKTLKSLNLFSNELKRLPKMFGGLQALEKVDLGKNQLTALPITFQGLKSIQGTINLCDNDFDEKPEFLWNMKGIRHVILSGNPLRIMGGSYTVHMVRGDTAFGNGQMDEAIKHYTRVLDIDPRNIEAIDKRAKIFHRIGDTRRAIEDLGLAILINFEDASLYYNRGKLYLQLGDSKKALFDFMQALDRNPELKAAMLGQADAYNQLGRFDSAISNCKLAMGDLTKFEEWNTSETVKECLRIAGFAYMKRGHVPRAMSMFENLLERDVENPHQIIFYKGLGFRDMDSFKDAIAMFTEIIVYFDETPEAFDDEPGNRELYNMAVMNRMAAYGGINQPKLANKDFERVNPREPTEEILEAVAKAQALRAKKQQEKKEAAKRRLLEREQKLGKQIEMMKEREQKESRSADDEDADGFNKK